MDHLHVSSDQYNRLIERLAVQIYESGWRFDSVICLARGGMRVGDILSRIFDKPLGVMTTSSYRAHAGTQQGKLTIAAHISAAEPVTEGRVLVADDLVDSGVTLAKVLPELRSRHAGITELRTAVLWLKGHSEFWPDYHVETLATNPWIHQPFEIYESMDLETLRARIAS